MFDDILSRFDIIHKCNIQTHYYYYYYRQTIGRTDGRTAKCQRQVPHLCIASHGKKNLAVLNAQAHGKMSSAW